MSREVARTAFARWLDGDLVPSEEATLRDALAADHALRAACAADARLAAALVALHGAARGPALAAMIDGHLAARSARHAARSAATVARRARRPRFRMLPIAAAAALLLALGAGWLVLAQTDDPTAAGGYALPGGGTVQADPGSVVVRDGDGWRLEHGRVAVEAAPQPGGVVAVRTAEASCRIVGTRFTVARSTGRTEVAVAHGQVEVAGAGGALLLPAGGTVVADAGAMVADLAWRSGDPLPPWLAIGRLDGAALAAERFPDRFGTLGVDLKPLRLALRGDSAVELRVRLDGDPVVVELWCRTSDGRTWVWEEFRPPLATWFERRVPFAAWRDDSTRSVGLPPGSVVDWLHLSTRDGPGRSLRVERLAITGWGPEPTAP
jgi:ferric-dicitrate binding protein FerR (iron transport regulator)